MAFCELINTFKNNSHIFDNCFTLNQTVYIRLASNKLEYVINSSRKNYPIRHPFKLYIFYFIIFFTLNVNVDPHRYRAMALKHIFNWYSLSAFISNWTCSCVTSVLQNVVGKPIKTFF